MRIFAISDLHLSFGSNKPMHVFGGNWQNYLEKIKTNWQNQVQENDIVLIAGDISWAMKLEQTVEDFKFLNSLKGRKIIIRGNHDYWWSSISAVRNALPENIFAIQNDAIKFNNYIICGTRGWTVPEKEFESEQDKKIFQREVIRLDLTLQSAVKLRKGNEEIICMIHYPPFNSRREVNDFTKLFDKYNVDKVVFGHLHGKKIKSSLIFNFNKRKYFLTSCDLVNNNLVLIADDEKL